MLTKHLRAQPLVLELGLHLGYSTFHMSDDGRCNLSYSQFPYLYNRNKVLQLKGYYLIIDVVWHIACAQWVTAIMTSHDFQ